MNKTSSTSKSVLEIRAIRKFALAVRSRLARREVSIVGPSLPNRLFAALPTGSWPWHSELAALVCNWPPALWGSV